MALWDIIADHITDSTQIPFHCEQQRSVGGGCINSAYAISGNDQHYFVKLNDGHRYDMFEAEAEGLREIAATQSIRVPNVICYGIADQQAFLVLEKLDLSGRDNPEQLGHNLAQMHRCTADRFGWYRDNTIGATPQPNQQNDDWIAFWANHRLGFQLELAAQNGYRGQLQALGDTLLERLPLFFEDYQPKPSLLHGDLWSGNYATCADGTPVIFDPAVYYGDREADLAMTELFGGFPPSFYRAYNDAFALAPGYTKRKTLYNLYHILNHLNLFGSGYLGQAESMLGQLVRQL